MTQATLVSAMSGTGGAKVSAVKWENPTQELAGIAVVCAHLMKTGQVQGREICLVVPNQNWGKQMMVALQAQNIPTTSCLPVLKVSQEAQEVLAKLDGLAEDAKAGKEVLCGLSLVHAVGAQKCGEFAHGLLHVSGKETPEELAALLREQLVRPSMPEFTAKLPIMMHGKVTGTYKRVFLVGFVNGLVPGKAAFEAEDPKERTRALDADREAFIAELGAATEEATVSSFVKVDAEFAKLAHIRFVRKIAEGGRTMAMAQPCEFLQEAGLAQPSTVGGQALLRSYGLN